jgi:hypothetical protein
MLCLTIFVGLTLFDSSQEKNTRKTKQTNKKKKNMPIAIQEGEAK